MRIKLGSILATLGVTAWLAACAPLTDAPESKQAASQQAPISDLNVGADWCFQNAPTTSTAPSVRARTEQGLRWLEQARRTGDSGYLVPAAACAALGQSDPSAPPPLSPDVTLNLLRMQILMSRHDFKHALAFAEQWLATGDAPALAMLLASDALLELGDVEQATTLANAAMRLRPDQNAYARVAHLRWLHGDIEGAKALYLDLLKNRDPANPEATAQRFLELAKLVQMQGDEAGARALVDAGLQAMPMHRDSLLWLAHASLAAGALPKARQVLQRLEQGIVDIPVLALKRDLLQREQRADQVAAVNLEIERLGRRGEGLAYALDLLARHEAPDRALALIQAARQQRNGLELDAAEARARWQLGQADAALTAIDRALRFGTPEPTWFALRAEVLATLGRPAEASETLAQVAAIQVLAPAARPTQSPTHRSL